MATAKRKPAAKSGKKALVDRALQVTWRLKAGGAGGAAEQGLERNPAAGRALPLAAQDGDAQARRRAEGVPLEAAVLAPARRATGGPGTATYFP